jgi:predicted ATPase/DNA-binding SARP family transcriptional activator
MRYEFLGPLRVLDGEHKIDLGGPRQKAVLAVLLAAAPDEVSVDRLIDEVWGDEAPTTAAHVVRTYLSNLKGTLDGRIESDGRHYRLVTAGDDSDASELAATLQAARTLAEIDASTAVDRLASVLALQRGRPFEGTADDALLVQIKVASLDEQLLQARELQTRAMLALGRHDEAIPQLEALVHAHPLREAFSELLMLALYRSERQAEALSVYRKLRKRLVEELGLEPSFPLRELEERILLQDPALDLQPPHNLPTPTSDFVGRVDELGQISKDLQAYRLVTLVGTGGVGKTRLAREAALERLGDFCDGIWWVNLAPIEDPDAALRRVAEVLSVSPQPGLHLIEVLRRVLAHRTTLVILDNCEHQVDAAARIAATLLDAGPGVKVLATSRKALGVSGETRYVVPPMSVPDTDHPDRVMGLSDAEMLFRARAHQADPATVFGDSAGMDVARICRQLDGLPLGIEMAAARTSVLSPAQIAERLERESPGLLALRESDRSPRQLTMESAIGWSYDLLTPVEQIVFRRLAVFASPFDIRAAEAVAGFDPVAAGEVLDVLDSLIGWSMVTTVQSERTVRYRLLQTVRQFALHRLSESGEEEAATRLHAHHQLGIVDRASEVRLMRGFAEIADELDAVRDDLSSALDWTLQHAPERAIAAAPGLAEYWSRRGDTANAYRYGQRMSEANPDASRELRADALLCASFGAALSGDFELAARGPAEAVELSVDAGWQTRLWALHALGNISTILGDLATVESMGHAILALCDREGLDLPRAYGTALLGVAEFFRDGDYELAGRYLDDAIEGMRSLHDYGGMKIYGLVTASTAAALRGDYESAERYATEAISLPGAAWTAAAYIVLGGYTLHPQGELERAGKVLERGTRMAYETGTEIWMRTGFLFLARLAAEKRRWQVAARLFGVCRPNLPAWGQQARWWDLESKVEAALGEDAYHRLEAAGRATPPDEALKWISEVLT